MSISLYLETIWRVMLNLLPFTLFIVIGSILGLYIEIKQRRNKNGKA